MAEIAIEVLVAQLPEEAKAWTGHLPVFTRAEIDRLLKETGVENFKAHWREHKADLDELESSFGAKP